MSLLTEETRSADVVALSPVRASVLPADEFYELAKQFPTISVVLTRLVAIRLGRKKHDALAGKTLDAYRIIERIGFGGMAVVYKAEELETGRQVALKMMSHRLVYDTTAFALFQREADIVESFDHENIVRVLGRFAAFRTYFIVMPYIEGSALEDLVRKQGPFPEPECRKIIGQAASALDFAHAADIIHRDVKPSNLLLTFDGVVKLMDFGLAKPVADSSLDKIDPIVGTPRHMAPEQWTGVNVGKAADYFGFGCTAYRLLTGKWLLSDTDVEDLLHHRDSWTAPQIEKLCPGVSDEMCEMIQTCIHHDQDERRIDLKQVARWAGRVDWKSC